MWGRDRDVLTGGVSSSRVGCGRLIPGTDPAPIGPRTISRGRLRLCTGSRCLRCKTVEGVWCAVVCAEQYTVCVDAREFCVSSVAPCALRVLLRFNIRRCHGLQPVGVRLVDQTHATCTCISLARASAFRVSLSFFDVDVAARSREKSRLCTCPSLGRRHLRDVHLPLAELLLETLQRVPHLALIDQDGDADADYGSQEEDNPNHRPRDHAAVVRIGRR